MFIKLYYIRCFYQYNSSCNFVWAAASLQCISCTCNEKTIKKYRLPFLVKNPYTQLQKYDYWSDNIWSLPIIYKIRGKLLGIGVVDTEHSVTLINGALFTLRLFGQTDTLTIAAWVQSGAKGVADTITGAVRASMNRNLAIVGILYTASAVVIEHVAGLITGSTKCSKG